MPVPEEEEVWMLWRRGSERLVWERWRGVDLRLEGVEEEGGFLRFERRLGRGE